MRKVCMCDFCNYIGTEADVTAHETICLENPSVQNCYNCAYAHEGFWSSEVIPWAPSSSSNGYLYCTFTEQPGANKISLHIKELPEEHICKHYQKGKPKKVIAV